MAPTLAGAKVEFALSDLTNLASSTFDIALNRNYIIKGDDPETGHHVTMEAENTSGIIFVRLNSDIMV